MLQCGGAARREGSVSLCTLHFPHLSAVGRKRSGSRFCGSEKDLELECSCSCAAGSARTRLWVPSPAHRKTDRQTDKQKQVDPVIVPFFILSDFLFGSMV